MPIFSSFSGCSKGFFISFLLLKSNKEFTGDPEKIPGLEIDKSHMYRTITDYFLPSYICQIKQQLTLRVSIKTNLCYIPWWCSCMLNEDFFQSNLIESFNRLLALSSSAIAWELSASGSCLMMSIFILAMWSMSAALY